MICVKCGKELRGRALGGEAARFCEFCGMVVFPPKDERVGILYLKKFGDRWTEVPEGAMLVVDS